MTTPCPVTPEIGPGIPGLPGVPASIGPLRCPECEQRAAVLHHVTAGDDWYTPTLVCQGCGSVFELEATAYAAGLEAGVLAERGRAPAAGPAGHALVTGHCGGTITARCQCGEPFGEASPADLDHIGREWEQHMKTEENS